MMTRIETSNCINGGRGVRSAVVRIGAIRGGLRVMEEHLHGSLT